ncbi:MAG: hypothetical protein L6R42_009679, partial [Xanthoria sp. 1 TBL-2021]
TTIPPYEELLDQARRLCIQSKPPFAQERRGIEDGHLKEVVLVNPDGRKPDLSPSVPREVFTARGWNEKYYFWVLDRGTEQFIMKALGGFYRRCIGIDGNKKAICESYNFAFPVSDPTDGPLRSTVPDSNPGVPEHFMYQSPFRRHEANLTIMSRKRRLSHDDGNDANIKAPSAVVHASQSLTVQEIVEQDRVYFASRNERPPYVKEASTQRQFVAVLADQDKRHSEHQIVVHARHWSGGLQYWIINLDGEERIVEKLKGGKGGYRLRLWLGHKEYEQGNHGEIVGLAPLPTKRDFFGQVTTGLPGGDSGWSKNTRQHSMPSRNKKQARYSEPSIQRRSNTLSRAISVPIARATTDVSQQSRPGQDSTQIDNKARTPKRQLRKSTGTMGYRFSPLGTVTTALAPTPTDVGNGRSTNSRGSRGEPCTMESTEDSVSAANVSTNTGPSPEELRQRKREIQRKQILLDRKLLSLDMEEIDDQLKKAGVP